MEKKISIWKIEAGVLKQGEIDGVLYDMRPVSVNEDTNKERKVRRKKRKLPDGCVGWDDSYKIFITKEEEMNVRRALNYVEHGWKPTTENIRGYLTEKLRVHITMDRLLAVLHWMRTVGIITKVSVLNRKPVYDLSPESMLKKEI